MHSDSQKRLRQLYIQISDKHFSFSRFLPAAGAMVRTRQDATKIGTQIPRKNKKNRIFSFLWLLEPNVTYVSKEIC